MTTPRTSRSYAARRSGTAVFLFFLVAVAAWVATAPNVSAAAPDNDRIVTASPLVESDSAVGDNTEATTSIGETAPPCFTLGVLNSIWYSWTAPDDRQVTFTSTSPSIGTQLAVYTGSTMADARLVPGACGQAAPGQIAEANLEPSTGTTYLIQVDGGAGATAADITIGSEWGTCHTINSSRIVGDVDLDAGECVALEAIYEDLNGARWNRNDGWTDLDTNPPTTDPCQWHGLTCTDGLLTGINLYNNDLSGQLPAEIT